MLLQELYNNNMISFAEKCDDWKEAIFESIEPLVQQKIIDSKYGQEIIESVEKYGPYIVISEDVCIPHASVSEAVHSSGIAMLVVQTPVNFENEEEFRPRIFFPFCALDSDVHLANLAEISDLCSDEKQLQKILSFQRKEDVEKYLNEAK